MITVVSDVSSNDRTTFRIESDRAQPLPMAQSQTNLLQKEIAPKALFLFLHLALLQVERSAQRSQPRLRKYSMGTRALAIISKMA